LSPVRLTPGKIKFVRCPTAPGEDRCYFYH
jgi:hypothetical protein